MCDRAVVALEVVLRADLPVRLVLGLGPLTEGERVDIDAVGGEQCRQLAQMLLDLSGFPTVPDAYKQNFYFSVDQWDGYRSERLPANLLQAQRDYFGAHTYERVDTPRGQFFHTNWTGRGGTVASGQYTV